MRVGQIRRKPLTTELTLGPASARFASRLFDVSVQFRSQFRSSPVRQVSLTSLVNCEEFTM